MPLHEHKKNESVVRKWIENDDVSLDATWSAINIFSVSLTQ